MNGFQNHAERRTQTQNSILYDLISTVTENRLLFTVIVQSTREGDALQNGMRGLTGIIKSRYCVSGFD